MPDTKVSKKRLFMKSEGVRHISDGHIGGVQQVYSQFKFAFKPISVDCFSGGCLKDPVDLPGAQSAARSSIGKWRSGAVEPVGDTVTDQFHPVDILQTFMLSAELFAAAGKVTPENFTDEKFDFHHQ